MRELEVGRKTWELGLWVNWKPLDEFLTNLLLWLCWVLVVEGRIFRDSTQVLWLWCLGSVVKMGSLSCFEACGILVP